MESMIVKVTLTVINTLVKFLKFIVNPMLFYEFLNFNNQFYVVNIKFEFL